MKKGTDLKKSMSTLAQHFHNDILLQITGYKKNYNWNEAPSFSFKLKLIFLSIN